MIPVLFSAASPSSHASHLHGGYSDSILERGDLVQIETTPNVRHYHARFPRRLFLA